ncbi:Alpha/Beta hydrolase protein [Gloeopeniophorella convolvens]|nr:Alpha/Beta hydrolase protein [Gloeopeniophorella convolvens]
MRSFVSSALFSLLVLSGASRATSIKRQSVTALSQSQISAFKPFTQFTGAVYCQPSTTLSWTCGTNCDANPDFIPTASGGDGNGVQYWYVGFSPSQDTVIVAHQGTNTTQFVSRLADLTDLDLISSPLDPTLFPNVPLDALAHSGFSEEQAKTASDVLSAVQTTLDAHNANTVTIVGHSLGAAIALLDSVYLPLHLPTDVNVRSITYGLPRVGNQAFADYVDAHLNLTHINNEEDPIPIVPGRFLGYVHPSGEIHIQDSGVWSVCPGQENPSTSCTDGDVPSIFGSNETNHDGPYDGVELGSCTP